MQPSVGYVVTNHPRVALTFIAREIAELEARGWTVDPISINYPSPTDLDATGADREVARTFYIKRTPPLRVLAALWRAARRNPTGLMRLAWRAARTGGTDVKAVVWRLFYLVEGVVVWDHCRRGPVRHLHAHFGQTPASIAWYATEVGHLCGPDTWTWSFTIHGFQDFVNERDARLDLKAHSASFIVCVSDFTRSQLMRVTDPHLWHRFKVVRCGLDLDAFSRRDAHPRSARARIITVARISPEKGHVVLLEALRVLRDRGVIAELEFVGSGDFTDEVRRRAAELGVAEQVHFTGELEPPAVIERLRGADIFCLPSFAEGLPVSIMEAMAVGVPVVSTYISGIPELAIHRQTALTVPAGSVDALADALEELIADPHLAEQLADAAEKAVRADYSSARNVDLLAVAFTEAMRRGPDAAP